ncbi:MAG: SAM-dependent methyltransferase [Burkholderiales bacterium]
MPTGRLFLIPTDLGTELPEKNFSARHQAALASIDHLVVENPKAARKFLKSLGIPVQQRTMDTLDAETDPQTLQRLSAMLDRGVDLGLLSDAGCPGIADPGAALVAQAHRLGAQVVPLEGPCSIVLALMASGLNGQRFAFHGYLPQRSPAREERIGELEAFSRRFDQTQIFIETPYRNVAMFNAMLTTCRPQTLICVASDLTRTGESVVTRTVLDWKKKPPVLDKRPTVFLMFAAERKS